MTNTKRVLVVLASLAISSSVLGTMDTLKKFNERYPEAKAKLGKCTTCHVKPLPKKDDAALNPYGKDVGKGLDFAGAESKDSDGDGVKNIDEIKAGTNPGDPSSK